MDRWEMVGRVEEQAYINSVIADPEQSGVLIAGRAGVGKTRLVREVIDTATNCHVELVTATESARPLPFGAFAQLLPEELATIDRFDLLAVIGRQLVRRAEGRPPSDGRSAASRSPGANARQPSWPRAGRPMRRLRRISLCPFE